VQLLGRRTLILTLPPPPTPTLTHPPTLPLPLPLPLTLTLTLTLALARTLTLTLTLIRCNYWDDDTRAWSSEGCTSTGVTEVNGCAAPAAGVNPPSIERRLTEASSGDVSLPLSPPPSSPSPLFPAPWVDPNVACAYAMRCECTHLTDFAGMPPPLTLGT
jgi:hypothetical protein